MKRWLWFLAALLISTGVYFTIRYGLRPKPIPVLNPTHFENAEQIGAVVYRGLRREILVERLILLGSMAEGVEYQAIWTGFLKAALADGNHVESFFQRSGLQAPQNLMNWMVIPYAESMIHNPELISQVSQTTAPGHLVIVHGLTQEVTHLMPSSLSRALDTAAQHPVLSLSLVSLSAKPDALEQLQDQCAQEKAQSDDHARISCPQARVTKTLIKKKAAPGTLWAVMERHGLKEYLIFVLGDH